MADTTSQQEKVRQGPNGAAAGASPVDRAGALVDLEMVNIFAESVSHEEVSIRPRPRARSVKALRHRLFVQAWVSNVGYSKTVWVDVDLLDAGEHPLHSETLRLDFLEPAGGGGDFFALDSFVPSPEPAPAVQGAGRLRYRVYYWVNHELFTDGVLHEHLLPEPPPKPARKSPARPAGRTRSGSADGSGPAGKLDAGSG